MHTSFLRLKIPSFCIFCNMFWISFGFFRFFFQKNANAELMYMWREIQNPLMFETDPESFYPGMHFIYTSLFFVTIGR
jgi:hypothetical protein